MKDLCANHLWWYGPKWLKEPTNQWPEISSTEPEIEEETKVETKILNACEQCSVDKNLCSPFDIEYTKYSSFTRLIRVTAWMLRFVKRLLKQSYETDSLTSEELTEAEKIWIRYTQRKHFPYVLDKVHDKRTNIAQQLGVFKDEEGLLRCRGRLEHSNLSQGARYPILLHGKERLTSMIVDRVHRSNLHCGISQTLAQIRLKYWIPKGRSVIRTVQRNCNVCRRHEGGPYRMPALAPLPPSRVQEAPPFSRTGLDYFGPLYIKTSEGPRKTWVCLFTCMVIRAVHLELLQDMTTEEFLMGFKRFISQRGTPNEIVSDNARQFKAASEVLKQIWKTANSDIVQSYITTLGINWKFIIELSPWMGGFYERLVGVVKRSLRKAIGRRMLTLIQLQTILKQVEAIVNSRPLVYIDNDINSCFPLTPNHFLTLNPCTGIPEIKVNAEDPEFNSEESTGERLLQIWKKGQKLLSEFWRIWREDYLANLRERTQSELKTSRIQSEYSPKIGDVVLVKDSTPRGTWKMGKLAELIVSRDGNIRAAKIRLSSGSVINRPLKLLFPIECASESTINRNEPLMNSDQPSNNSYQRPTRQAKERARHRIKQNLAEKGKRSSMY